MATSSQHFIPIHKPSYTLSTLKYFENIPKLLGHLPIEVQEDIVCNIPVITEIGVMDFLWDAYPREAVRIARLYNMPPYTRKARPNALINCTCDSKEDSMLENLEMCCARNHVCMCALYPSSIDAIKYCRARIHICVCHIHTNDANDANDANENNKYKNFKICCAIFHNNCIKHMHRNDGSNCNTTNSENIDINYIKNILLNQCKPRPSVYIRQ